jgi:huntingtin-interacting protein 1-related protein
MTYSGILHRQPILADEVQTFKALITVHKVLQEGHPIVVREAQENRNWLESLTRGITGEGLRGMAVRIVYAKLHRAFSNRERPLSTLGKLTSK